MSEATRTISPTKTLEYMAGGKPIVSTAVRDVVRDRGDLVFVADDPAHSVELAGTAFDWFDAERAEAAQHGGDATADC